MYNVFCGLEHRKKPGTIEAKIFIVNISGIFLICIILVFSPYLRYLIVHRKQFNFVLICLI